MWHVFLFHFCVAGIASANSLSEADISARYNPGTAVTPASVQTFGSTPVSYPIGPTITTYSTLPQSIEDTAAISHQPVLSHIGCKCNKKKTATNIKFGTPLLPQTGDVSSAFSQTEAVPAIVTSTPAPIDGSPVIYIAAPPKSQTQETVPGHNGYDTSPNKVITSPTGTTNSATFEVIKNLSDQKVSTFVGAANNANLYPGTPSDPYFSNPSLPFGTSPNNANLYQAFSSPTNYPKYTAGLDFSGYNSPYVVNPYDPSLPYSHVNPTAYAVNPYAAASQNAAGPSDPNAGFIIYSAVPLAQPNNLIQANSPLVYPVAPVTSSTPRPIIFAGSSESQNIAPNVGGAYSSYGNNAAAYSSVAASPRPVFIYSRAPGEPSAPSQFAYPAVNNNRVTNIQSYVVPQNSAIRYSSLPDISAFSRPGSFASGPRPLLDNSVAGPVVHNYGSVTPDSSNNAASAKSGKIYSSAPEVSRVHYNGGGISYGYSW